MPRDDLYPPEFGSRPTPGPGPREIRAEARQVFVRRALYFAVGLLIVACTLTTTVGVVLIRQYLGERAKVSDRISECTTPGRPCYDQGQKNLALVIIQLNQYGIAVASCASGTVEKTDQQIVKCVVSKGLPAPKQNQLP